MKVDFAVLSRARERRDPPTPQPAHRTKGSSDLASSEVTRIAATWPFLELVKAATGETEMVSRRAVRSSPPHTPGARMTVVTLTPSNYFYDEFYTSR